MLNQFLFDYIATDYAITNTMTYKEGIGFPGVIFNRYSYGVYLFVPTHAAISLSFP